MANEHGMAQSVNQAQASLGALKGLLRPYEGSKDVFFFQVRVANEHGMTQAVNQLRAFSAARLEFFGERGGACTITSVSDGNKALEEWRQV